jgi:hypothetical protein
MVGKQDRWESGQNTSPRPYNIGVLKKACGLDRMPQKWALRGGGKGRRRSDKSCVHRTERKERAMIGKNMAWGCFACLLILSASALPPSAAETAEDSKAASDPAAAVKTITAQEFTFQHRIDGDNLVASVSCPTAGWVAVGFNPTTFMSGARLIMGCVKDGQPVIEQDYGTGWFSHREVSSLGGKNSIVAADCKSENGVVTLSFTTPLESGGAKDTAIVLGKPTRLIFATGKGTDFKEKHVSNAKTKVVF